jgi:hypothetical protein
MFHPLAPDLSNLKDDEIYDKINDLNRKMSQAWRLGSNDAIQQLQMLLRHYQEEASNRNRKKLQELEERSKSFNKIIDIK